MSLRVLTLFLAFILGWSGFTTPEQRHAALDATTAHAVVSLADTPADVAPGSLDDHYLDDLPSQSHGESWGEAPGLIRLVSSGPPAELTLQRPLGRPDDARPDPWLEGLQRPPCAAPSRA